MTRKPQQQQTAKKKGGIDYGNVEHLGVAAMNDPNGPRRQSLAESPYRGRIDSIVSPPPPRKT